MKKIIILLFVISPLFVFSQGGTDKSEINWLSLEEAKKFAKKYDKTIFIYFYKENCPYCEEMKKKNIK